MRSFLGKERTTFLHERWFCLLGADWNGSIGSRLDGVVAYHMFWFMNCYQQRRLASSQHTLWINLTDNYSLRIACILYFHSRANSEQMISWEVSASNVGRF